MSLIAAVKSVFSKYATFSGRARRAEYWWFALAYAIVIGVLYGVTVAPSLAAVAAGDATGPNPVGLAVYSIVTLALLLPTLAVLVRRLHDTNRSGGWFWITFVPAAGPIWLLVLLASAGTVGPNRFGEDPKAVAAPVAPQAATV